MAIVLVQHVMSSDTASSNVLTATFASSTAGTLIVVIARTTPGMAPITGVTDGTTAFTHATASAAADVNAELDIWYLLSANAGKTSVAITWTGTSTNRRAEVFEVSGFTSCTFDNAATRAQPGLGFDYPGPVFTTHGTIGFAAAGLFANLGAGTLTNPATGNEYNAGGDATGGNGYISLISSSAGSHQADWTGTVGSQDFVSTVAGFYELSSFTGVSAPIAGEDDGLMPYIVANEPSIISVW